MKKYFGTIYSYDTETDTWYYDCKYYSKDSGNTWYNIYTDELVEFKLNALMIKHIQDIKNDNKDLFKEGGK